MTGFVFPNEMEIQWGLLLVLYPYITGLVAGAFIVASLKGVFNIREVEPAYRLALLTALAFVAICTMPLLIHLGHPLRGIEMFLTPNPSSAMAMFGLVYLWYLVAILLLEIWFDYRQDLVLWSRREHGFWKFVHSVLTLGADDLSPRAVQFDHSAVRVLSLLGIPSAFVLHGYVGFIFGAVKANAWWSSVLMPLVFLMSAIVSGVALVMLLYVFTTWVRRKTIEMACLDRLAPFLLYAIIIDFTLEVLEIIHRRYLAEEGIAILTSLVVNRLYFSMIILQILVGTVLPMIVLALVSPAFLGTIIIRTSRTVRLWAYILCGLLIQVGIFSMRWNVVVGGQLVSKSLRGLQTYVPELLGRTGLLMGIGVLITPFVVLFVLTLVLPPWPDAAASESHAS
jgi:Ni/Fe-hydrogenase subunit HybB-like protein